MKTAKPNQAVVLLLFSAALVFTSALHADASGNKATLQDVEQETTELLQTLSEYSAAQRDEAERKSEAALQRLDRRIDALETRIDNNWDQMNQAARDNARASLRSLRKQRTRVAEWYGGMKNSSADAWSHMKTGFSKAYRSLSDAWEKSANEFSDVPQDNP